MQDLPTLHFLLEGRPHFRTMHIDSALAFDKKTMDLFGFQFRHPEKGMNLANLFIPIQPDLFDCWALELAEGLKLLQIVEIKRHFLEVRDVTFAKRIQSADFVFL